MILKRVFSCLAALACVAQATWAVEGTPVVIMPAATSGDVDAFTMTPDGQTILLVGSLDDGVSGDQLYSVPAAGGMATLLSDPSLHNDVDEAPVTDGTVAYFKGDQTMGNANNDWFQVPLTGGPQVAITDNTGIAGDAQLINGGNTLIYLNDESDEDNLFIAPTDGSLGVTQISPSMVDIDQAQWDVTNDGMTAIYGSQPLPGPQPVEFASIATDGSTVVPTSIPVTGVSSVFEIVDMEITPDDTEIVFTAENDFNGPEGLYKVDIAGGSLETIVSLSNEDQDIDWFKVSPDGTMVAFVGDLEEDGSDELFVVNLDGSGLTNLTPNIPSFSDVGNGYSELAWSADGQSIYFLADQEVDGTQTLYVTQVPEPASAILMILAFFGLTSMRRR